MFRPKPLIHLLVSLMLVLNGIGADTVSVRMDALPADEATQDVAVRDTQGDSHAVAMESGCKGHDSATPLQGEKGQSFDINSGKRDSASSDCCVSDACNCGCVHSSHVVLASWLLAMPTIAHASIQREALGAPASPSLVHPTRPPII